MSTQPPELSEEELAHLDAGDAADVLLDDGSLAPAGPDAAEVRRRRASAREGL